MSIFRRKITDEIQEWKDEDAGDCALLVEGVRGVGKSTVVREFAKSNYDSCLIIDFSDQRERDRVSRLFCDMYDLDFFYEQLQAIYNVKLVSRRSVIILEEVQYFMRARQCIDYLVKDGRYDFIETGSLQGIGIRREKIRVPGEEHYVDMYPMDFEEFLWALHGNDKSVTGQIRNAYACYRPLGQALHESIMEDFKKYMLVGGMPQTVAAYMDGGEDGFACAEQAKRMLLDLCAEDMGWFSGSSEERDRIVAVLKQIPLQLTGRDKRFDISKVAGGSSWDDDYVEAIDWLDEAGMIKGCLKCMEPKGLLGSAPGETSFKCYMADAKLLTTMEHIVEKTDDMFLHRAVMGGNFGVYEGMLLENTTAQMLAPSRLRLYFYRHYDGITRTVDIDTDFIVHQGFAKCPIEIRAAGGSRFASFGKLKSRYVEDIGKGYILHTGNFSVSGDIVHLPVYMTMLL